MTRKLWRRRLRKITTKKCSERETGRGKTSQRETRYRLERGNKKSFEAVYDFFFVISKAAFRKM